MIIHDPRLNKIQTAIGKDVEAYIVGGYVRDFMLGIIAKDIDIVVEAEAVEEIAGMLACEVGGHFFYLREEHQLIRVEAMAEDGAYTIDLAPLMTSIESDLARRDFTVNAIAIDICSLNTPHPEFIDPLEAIADIQSKTLRVASKNAITDDPLRILRGARFSVSLGLSIPSLLMEDFCEAASGLPTVPGERIFEELARLAMIPEFSRALSCLKDAMALQVLFPECAGLFGVTQNEYHHLDAWDHTLESINQSEEVMGKLHSIWPLYAQWLEAELSQTVQGICTRRGAVKLGLLFHDIGKALTHTIDEEGAIHFYGHDKAGIELFAPISKRLKSSRKLDSIITTMIREHLRPGFYAKDKISSKRTLARLFRASQGWFAELIIVAAADRLAARGPKSTTEIIDANLVYLEYLMSEYLKYREIKKRQPLIKGGELIAALKIAPGLQVGELQRAIDQAHEAGEINTREEALLFARKLIEP